MKNLIILGAGGFGREVLVWGREAVQHGKEWEIKGFLDDNPAALAHVDTGVPILGSIAGYVPAPQDVFVCAMGNVAAKKRCIEIVLARGGVFAQLVHRSAIVAERASLGHGVIVCPLAVVSVDAALDDFTTVNYHSTVAHDAVIGAFSQLHCHVDITGLVKVGCEVLVGSHASVLSGVSIGDRATVGAGSVVLSDVPPGATVFGNPARVLKPSQRE